MDLSSLPPRRRQRIELRYMVLDYILYVRAKQLGWLKFRNTFFSKHFTEQFGDDILILGDRICEECRPDIVEFYQDYRYFFHEQFCRFVYRFFNRMPPAYIHKTRRRRSSTENTTSYDEREDSEAANGIPTRETTEATYREVLRGNQSGRKEPDRINYLSLGCMFAIAGEFALVCFQAGRKDHVGNVVCAMYRLISNFENKFYELGGFGAFVAAVRENANGYKQALLDVVVVEAFKDSIKSREYFSEFPDLVDFGVKELNRIKLHLRVEEEQRLSIAKQVDECKKAEKVISFYREHWENRYRRYHDQREGTRVTE